MSAEPVPIAVLTRPAGQNAGLAQALAGRGWRALELPALRLTPVAGVPPDPAAYGLAVFVSGNAVRMFLDQCRAAWGGQWTWPEQVAAAVVGPASAAALRAHPAFGNRPRIVQPAPNSPHFDSESLWDVLAASPMPASALIVRGGSGAQGKGRDWLAGRLRQAGVPLDLHRAYRREPQAWPADALEALRELARRGQGASWLLTSAEGVDAVAQQLARAGLLPWWADCRLVATHPRIARHLITVMEQALPGRVHPLLLQTCAPTDEAVLAAIESVS
ncbi:Uroporphyrinogen-III synthase [Pigmentiphaga humi]|uniref:Uroporphyrinogen-III synthase n=1 Tax=Pigmentiphaga humi TaxID=2478468 RepID=A0A3P4B129_9BURK|nr:uroporphyrinogen-III synthase [Pigmentiphaga humi]VCU69266.1 Uroporphyrinogen-III synthase [Pigmentiphaga humi]